MTHDFLTRNKDLGVLILSKLVNNIDFLNALTVDKTAWGYSKREDLWRIRFQRRCPDDFDLVSNLKKRSWRDFSLLLTQYLALSEGDHEISMGLAARYDKQDLVDFFIFKGVKTWQRGLRDAAEGGHRHLVEFFISKGANDWNWAMYGAAEGGHRDLVDFFIKKGADNWNRAMQGAILGDHRDLLDFFISKGADNWYGALCSAAQGGHRDLVDFFISKGADNWDAAAHAAQRGGHQDLSDFFKSKIYI